MTGSIAATRDAKREIAATLRIQHLKDVAEGLFEGAKALQLEADHETDSTFSMRLEMLRLETYRLAQDYSHASLKMALEESK